MNSPVREWRGLRDAEHAEWGAGQWTSEPDKMQWVDAATGLDCLIVRNGLGALCGYVGVGPEHPWHGKSYSACTLPTPCGESYCEHGADFRIEIHGGLTFADGCREPTHERWNRMRTSAIARGQEARDFPRGDSARFVREMRPFMGEDRYEAWREHFQGLSICHVPAPGRPANVWWFGFDCAHHGDLTPGLNALASGYAREWETYRDIDYVTREVTSLAQQLADYGATHETREVGHE